MSGYFCTPKLWAKVKYKIIRITQSSTNFDPIAFDIVYDFNADEFPSGQGNLLKPV